MSKAAEYITKRAELFGFQANSRNSLAFSREFMQSTKESFTWELDNHGDLKCYKDAEERICSTNTVVSVEQRPGTNILIIGCGPGGRILTFIEFDTKEQADEWHEALCKFVGQEYNPPLGFRRVRTEIKSTGDKKKLCKTTSALPDILQKKPEAATTALMPVERTMVEPISLHQHKEGDEQWTKEELIRSASSLSSSSNSSDISQPGSLSSSIDSRSSQLMESDTSERRYTINELLGTVLVDYNGQVCVHSSKPGSGIHVGDRILAIDAFPNLDARAMAEYIQRADCEKFSLRISHGVRCAISTQEHGFQMDLRGGDLVHCDVHHVVRTVCHLACTTKGRQSSTLAVTDPVNFLEETDVRKEVVEDEAQEILRETPTVIHLQPECLLRALKQLKGICIGQGLRSSSEVVTGSDHSTPGSGNRGRLVTTPEIPVDSQIIPAQNKSSSSSVEGAAAGGPEDSSSSSSTESTKVTFRKHGNTSRSRQRQRPLGEVFPDVE